ncbi:DHBP synthase RibB-like alpha/beta domain-containing protein [Mycena galericulata]|nr:DHBP synthase RibB-like alpha/beta domain-containing protein [Mycena galericulata]
MVPVAQNGVSSVKPLWRPTEVRNVPARTSFEFDPMEDALAAFSAGEFLVVMDDEARENEGDLIISASLCTTEKMAWMIKHTSNSRLPMMVPKNQERHRTAYTNHLARPRALASPTSVADDFTRPGHLVPLRAVEGGVLVRKGHTESGVDLCLITNQPPAGVLCELVNDDAEGTMARRDDCRTFADRWGLKMISVEMLAEWRRSHPLP